MANNPFLAAYIECALWSTNDEADESGGDPLDDNYTAADLAPEALARMTADCVKFQDDNSDTLADLDDSKAGHMFWLTRNGHGRGFWDGDYDKATGEALTKASKVFGECNLYVGDDGVIYHYPE